MKTDKSFRPELREAIKRLGGAKIVGPMLWPHREPEDAEQRCNDCCNPSRREKFSIEEVLQVLSAAREGGYHDAMHAFCAECGYDSPSTGSSTDGGVAAVPALLAKIIKVAESMDGKLGRLTDRLT